MSYYFGSCNMRFELFWIFLIFFVIIGIIFLLYKLKSDKQKKSDRRHYDEDLIQAQIRSMLYQNGGEMKQTDISAALEVPIDIVSTILNKMEQDGDISRTWLNDEFTFKIER